LLNDGFFHCFFATKPRLISLLMLILDSTRGGKRLMPGNVNLKTPFPSRFAAFLHGK